MKVLMIVMLMPLACLATTATARNVYEACEAEDVGWRYLSSPPKGADGALAEFKTKEGWSLTDDHAQVFWFEGGGTYLLCRTWVDKEFNWTSAAKGCTPTQWFLKPGKQGLDCVRHARSRELH